MSVAMKYRESRQKGEERMESLVVRVVAFVMGALAVLLNKYLGEFTGHWQVMLFGRNFGTWANRIPYILVGILAMIMSLLTT